jgi:hypothetical protein
MSWFTKMMLRSSLFGNQMAFKTVILTPLKPLMRKTGPLVILPISTEEMSLLRRNQAITKESVFAGTIRSSNQLGPFGQVFCQNNFANQVIPLMQAVRTQHDQS